MKKGSTSIMTTARDAVSARWSARVKRATRPSSWKRRANNMAVATKIVAVTGNQAVAEAFRQLNPDVMPAYPITPSTGIMESFTKFVSDGKVDTETILVESEHSAMSACIGAAAAGGRVATATSA